jgi:hypothetical protein
MDSRRSLDIKPSGSLDPGHRPSADSSEPRPSADPDRSWPLNAIRYVLPAAVVIGGLVVMALGSENDLEGGAGIVSAGLAIYFLNWLFRLGTAGDRERDAEEAARDYFDRHGRWPS